MKRVSETKGLFVYFVQLLLFCTVLFMFEELHADSLEALSAALPDQINGWSKGPVDSIFDSQTIFEHIDGAGELYRSYKMQNCFSRRYRAPDGPDIVLDIFDMGSSDDAFGVFTHDRDGHSLDVGQEALYRSGWLSFWKNRFFVSIYTEEETVAAKQAVKRLAKAVASRIKDKGTKPGIIAHLPSEGLQPKSIRYFHHHVVLNHHFYLSDKNILELGPRTDAVLAQYERGEQFARLLLVTYSDRTKSKEALAQFLQHYLPEMDAAPVILLENGKWCAAAGKGKLLAVILEADSRQFAENLLKETVQDSFPQD